MPSSPNTAASLAALDRGAQTKVSGVEIKDLHTRIGQLTLEVIFRKSVRLSGLAERKALLTVNTG